MIIAINCSTQKLKVENNILRNITWHVTFLPFVDECLKYSTTTQIHTNKRAKCKNVADFNRKMSSWLKNQAVQNNVIKGWNVQGNAQNICSFQSYFLHFSRALSFFSLSSKSPFSLSPCQIYKGVPDQPRYKRYISFQLRIPRPLSGRSFPHENVADELFSRRKWKYFTWNAFFPSGKIRIIESVFYKRSRYVTAKARTYLFAILSRACYIYLSSSFK